MKIANFADVHSAIRNEFNEISNLTGSTRLDIIVSTIDSISDYCRDNNIPVAVCAGDIFHTRGKVGTKVYNALFHAIKRFSEKGIDLVIIPGNHDQVDNSDYPEHSLTPFSEIEGVYILDKMGQTLEYDEDVVFIGLPFSKNVDIVKGAIDEITSNIDNTKKNILIAHLGVSGAVINDDYVMQDAYSLDDLKTEYFKYVVLGHYHDRQMLNHNTFYTGSPVSHKFGEDGDKGFYIVDTDKRYNVQFVAINNPRFITVEGAEVSRKQLLEYADNGDFLRIKVEESQVDEVTSKIPSHLKYKLELTKSFESESRVDISIGMDFEEMVSKYSDRFSGDSDVRQAGIDIIREVQETI